MDHHRMDQVGAVSDNVCCLCLLQNNYAELYALLSLALPKTFPIEEAASFVRYFRARADDSTAIAKLHQLLAPIFLRRTLSDVPAIGACSGTQSTVLRCGEHIAAAAIGWMCYNY